MELHSGQCMEQLPSGVHRAHFPPLFGHNVKTAARVEVVHSVKPADHVDVEVDYSSAMISPRTRWINLLHL